MTTLTKLEKIIEAACKSGYFSDDYFFEYEPNAAAKLFDDRKRLLEAAEKARARLSPNSPAAILLGAAIEEAHAGWPKEPTESSET